MTKKRTQTKRAERKPREVTIKDMARGAAEFGMRLQIDAVPIEPMPFRSVMWKPEEYDGIDAGIIFAVKVLHAAGIETCQSCEGGAGHAYDHPTVDLLAGGDDAAGFAALAALADYGVDVKRVSIVWNIKNAFPYEKLWRIELARPIFARASDWPMFEWCYRAFTTA